MVILERFKSLNLKQKKMRKLCIDEVGFKMKKNEKNVCCNFKKKHTFFIAIFWLLLWLYISKMICRA
jgi:hypothetical protein